VTFYYSFGIVDNTTVGRTDLLGFTNKIYVQNNSVVSLKE
jgi:hypothetical protein